MSSSGTKRKATSSGGPNPKKQQLLIYDTIAPAPQPGNYGGPKDYKCRNDDSSDSEMGSDSDSDGDDGQFLIQRIVGKKTGGCESTEKYKVRWCGYKRKEDTDMPWDSGCEPYTRFEKKYSSMRVVPGAKQPEQAFKPHQRVLAPRSRQYTASKWPAIVCCFGNLPDEVRAKVRDCDGVVVRFFGFEDWMTFDQDQCKHVRVADKTMKKAYLENIPERKQYRFNEGWRKMWLPVTDDFVVGMPMRQITDQEQRKLFGKRPVEGDSHLKFMPTQPPAIPIIVGTEDSEDEDEGQRAGMAKVNRKKNSKSGDEKAIVNILRNHFPKKEKELEAGKAADRMAALNQALSTLLLDKTAKGGAGKVPRQMTEFLHEMLLCHLATSNANLSEAVLEVGGSVAGVLKGKRLEWEEEGRKGLKNGECVLGRIGDLEQFGSLLGNLARQCTERGGLLEEKYLECLGRLQEAVQISPEQGGGASAGAPVAACAEPAIPGSPVTPKKSPTPAPAPQAPASSFP